MSGYRNGAAVDADNLFDTDTVGDGPHAENFRLSNGVGLTYAAAPYGTPGPSFGYRNSAGVDNGPRWTTRGTATYALSINGKTYSVNSGTRGQVSVQFTILANGTWNVAIINSGGSPTHFTPDSGSWLPAGDAAANWSVQLTNDGSGIVDAHGGFTGKNTQTTTASTPQALSANQNAQQVASATTTGTNADWNGSITIKLFRLGALRSTTIVSTQLFCNGN